MELIQSQPLILVWLCILGLSVGFLTGLFGIGGAFVATPIMLMLGIESSVAIGSSMGLTLVNGMMGLRRHRGTGNFEPGAMFPIAIAACGGTIIGWMFHQQLKQASGENFNDVVNALFCAILVPIGLVVWWQSRDAVGRPLLAGCKVPRMVQLRQPDFPPVSETLLALIGFSIGIAKGMLGIGGGIILLPMLVLVVGLAPHRAVNVSLGVVVFSSIVGSGLYGWTGHINLFVVGAMLAGSLLGVVIGAKFCNIASPTRLKQMLAVMILGFSVYLGTRLF